MVHASGHARSWGAYFAAGMIALAIFLEGGAPNPASQAAKSSKPEAEAPKAQIPNNARLKPKPGNNATGSQSKISQHVEKLPRELFWTRLLHLMDRHNGALNAFFSGFVALFTLMLFLVGRDQHDTLKKSVAAAVKSADIAEKSLLTVERPYLNAEVTGGDIFDWSAISTEGQGKPKIIFGFKNSGRTGARVLEVRTSMQVSGGLPASPIYSDHQAGEYWIDAGESMTPVLFTFYRETLSLMEINAVMKGDCEVHLYCRARYSDVLGYTHTLGFCVRYIARLKIFTVAGGRAYNYRKTERSEDEE